MKKKVIKSEIFMYLEEYDCFSKQVLISRIVNVFGLSKDIAEEVYIEWKKQYMYPKVEVDYSKLGGYRNN